MEFSRASVLHFNDRVAVVISRKDNALLTHSEVAGFDIVDDIDGERLRTVPSARVIAVHTLVSDILREVRNIDILPFGVQIIAG